LINGILLSEFKLGKAEKKAAYDVLRYKNLYYSRTEKDDISSSEATKSHKKSYEELISKYLNPVEENFILDWERFLKYR